MKIGDLIVSVLLTIVFVFGGCSPDKPTPKKKSSKVQAKETPKAAKLASTPKIKTEVKSSEMDPGKMKKAKELIASVPQSDVDAVDAKKSYKKYCTTCHGFKGNAKINGATDLTKLKSTRIRKVAQIYFGKGVMTPFKGILSDAEVIAVAKYVEGLKK